MLPSQLHDFDETAPSQPTPFLPESKTTKEGKSKLGEFQPEDLLQTDADDRPKIKDVKVEGSFSKGFAAIQRSLKELQQLDQSQKNVLHLRGKAIDMLTEEVVRHKASTKMLESLGRYLSEEEGKKRKEQLESQQLAWSQADNARTEALVASRSRPNDRSPYGSGSQRLQVQVGP